MPIAYALAEQKLHVEAASAYERLLGIYRKLAHDNPAAWLRDVAVTLNNLGVLYHDTQRFDNADKAYSEALAMRRTLARATLLPICRTLPRP